MKKNTKYSNKSFSNKKFLMFFDKKPKLSSKGKLKISAQNFFNYILN